MAAFALNAHVAEFLDVVMHDDEFDFRIEQIRIPVDSPLCNRTLGDADLEVEIWFCNLVSIPSDS